MKLYLDQKFTSFTLIAACSLLLIGCGGKTNYGVAKINSKPSGAEIVNLKDNTHLGVTPAKVSFSGDADTSEQVTIQLRKTGYKDRITKFWINRRHSSAILAEEAAIDIHVELEKKAK